MSILSTIGAYIATKLDLKQDKNSPIDNANKLTTARSIALSSGVTTTVLSTAGGRGSGGGGHASGRGYSGAGGAGLIKLTW